MRNVWGNFILLVAIPRHACYNEEKRTQCVFLWEVAI